MVMNIVEKAQKEVDDNYVFFKENVQEWKKNYFGKFALLHERKIIDFFDSENDAVKVGMKDYGEGCFSVQQIDDKVIDLGYQSNVLV